MRNYLFYVPKFYISSSVHFHSYCSQSVQQGEAAALYGEYREIRIFDRFFATKWRSTELQNIFFVLTLGSQEGGKLNVKKNTDILQFTILTCNYVRNIAIKHKNKGANNESNLHD